MRKGDDGGKNGGEGGISKNKIKTFLVATNVVASRPPKRQPTGTPSSSRSDVVTKFVRPSVCPFVSFFFL